MWKHPIFALNLVSILILICIFDFSNEAWLHVVLNLLHPFLNPLACSTQLDSTEFNLLSFTWYHTVNIWCAASRVNKQETTYVIKTFVYMFLYLLYVSCISQNLQELIIWQEVESRKVLSFLFQVGIQIFLDFIKQRVVSLKFGQLLPTVTIEQDIWLVVYHFHHFIPLSTYYFKFLAVFCTLSFNIWRGKYIVQVKPCSLKFFPGL